MTKYESVDMIQKYVIEANVMQSMNLACITDEKFAIGAGVTLYSSLVNLSHKDGSFNIFVFDLGLTDFTKRRLEKVILRAGVAVNVIFHKVNITSLMDKRDNPIYYVPLIIPQLLPESIDRVLCLDSDMLILGDLWQLWNCNDEVKPILAVKDLVMKDLGQSGLAWACRELHLDPNLPYMNGGLQMLNLKIWRRDKLVEKCVCYLDRYGYNLGYVDQGILNAVFPGQWGELPLDWNALIKLWESYMHPKLWHFVGRPKPWTVLYPLRKPWQQYAKYLHSSKWFSEIEYHIWLFTAVLKSILQTF